MLSIPIPSSAVSRHTQRDYEDKVRLHIAPDLGSRRLADLTTADPNRFYRAKLQDGLSASHIRYLHTTLSKTLHEAEGADLVRKNVARWAKPPRAEHRELSVLSVEEVGRFLRAIRGDRLEALYLLAVTTGREAHGGPALGGRSGAREWRLVRRIVRSGNRQ